MCVCVWSISSGYLAADISELSESLSPAPGMPLLANATLAPTGPSAYVAELRYEMCHTGGNGQNCYPRTESALVNLATAAVTIAVSQRDKKGVTSRVTASASGLADGAPLEGVRITAWELRTRREGKRRHVHSFILPSMCVSAYAYSHGGVIGLRSH